MFEERLKEISNQLERQKVEYLILTHKRHRREVYFQNDKEAIKFLKIKFDPSLWKFREIKKIVYFLIKKGLLQPFLKKVKLSYMGDLIFVANQIKGFDLENRIVTSFMLEKDKKSFIKSKEFQMELGNQGFTPRVFYLNKEIPYSTEELLENYKGNDDLNVFKKLFSFYEKKGIKNGNTTIHGSFTKEQVLVKDDGSYVFTDWSLRKGFILSDLINFYRNKLENET